LERSASGKWLITNYGRVDSNSFPETQSG
jgi:hypothetical protein